MLSSLTVVSIIAPVPLKSTNIDVVDSLYPIPVLITITSSILPSFITGRNMAPTPPDGSSTVISGVDV